MSNDQWLVLALTCAVGIIGLFIAASGSEGIMYVFGLALFAAAVGYAFYLVKRYFDRLDQSRR